MTKINKILASPFILSIRIYQLFISPIIGSNCRYSPTCSQYGIIALKKYGILKGSILTAKRIARCNSLFKGGYDPVP